jgi:hypothetical protein
MTMANGDSAEAVGMDVVPGTMDLRAGYDEINKTRDYLAEHQTHGTHDATAINAGTLDLARLPKLDTAHLPDAIEGARISGSVSLHGVSSFDAISIGGVGAAIASNGSASFPGGVDAGPVTASTVSATGPMYTPHGRANPVSGFVAAGIGPDGRIAVSASSRRFKKDIRSWSPDRQAVLAMQMVTFRYKVAVDADSPRDYGLIAEDLDALGLTWLVFYDDEGRPQGVHYDKIALALLPVVQDHEARIAALEGKD